MARPAAPRRAAVALLAATAALAACTSAESGGPATTTATTTASPGPALSWSVVSLPAGVEPRTLTTMGDRLLVGGLKAGDTPETPSPAMLTVDSAGTQTRVPLNPLSPYAPVARWY